MGKYEHYEVWILDAGAWAHKSTWRDLEVGWAVARAHAGPVCIIRAMYEDDEEVERKVIAELSVARENAEF